MEGKWERDEEYALNEGEKNDGLQTKRIPSQHTLLGLCKGTY